MVPFERIKNKLLFEFSVYVLSCNRLFATLWTVAPLSMGFSRRKHWSGLPCLPPRDLPDPGIKSKSPVSPALQVDCLPTEPHGKPQYISATLESLMKMSLQKNVKIKTIWRKIQMTEQKGRAATVSFTLSPPLGTHQHVLNCQNVVTVVLLD